MNHEELSPALPKPVAQLLPIGVVLSLLLLVATYFSYLSRHQSHTPGSYLPLVIGIVLFFALMSWFNYMAFPSQTVLVRFARACGIALIESATFLCMLIFLILNTIGS